MSNKTSWHAKAQKIIEELCYESYYKVNFLKNGKKRKKHVPYTVPEMAVALVNCLKWDDEKTAKSIMLRYTVFGIKNMEGVDVDGILKERI